MSRRRGRSQGIQPVRVARFGRAAAIAWIRCGLFLFVLSLGVPGVWAQPRMAPQVARMRQALGSGAGVLTRPAGPHYDVVALRVAFQPDTSRFTTGDGTFEGTLFPDGLTPAIDPLPHDAAYFEAHLQFLEDYVARVSDGRTAVTTHLIPGVVTVSRPMGDYSPTGPEFDTDAQLKRLAALVEEAWMLADRELSFDLSGFDPRTTAFVLFHAGVGRDVELIGTTLDKTPADLPSLFFDRSALGRLLDGRPISFRGMPVENTLVLPRTEVRPGFDFIQDQSFLAEFSINGLLAASFLNYLGVPDLFNTETGESAIGPFGVMDGLGIFAFNGLFPPEPSAWTKQFLGWADVRETGGDGPIPFQLTHASHPSTSAVVRVPVSEAEYFLVENRNRDPEGDGLRLRVWKEGRITTQQVANGDPDFNRFVTSGFEGGVVVGVDDYDWALPGGLDENDNELNGGILVWHIDERVLRTGLPDNRVNADPLHRGVDLEEADGAQDIGFPNQNPFGPAFDTGSPFDFFFEDNPVVVVTQTGQEIRLYRNRFGPDTFPDSRTNDGGQSFVVLDAFSRPGPTMTFSFRKEGAFGLAPLAFGSVTLGSAFGEGSFVKKDPGRDVVAAYAAVARLYFVDIGDGRVLASFPSAVAPVDLGNGRYLTLRDEGDGRYRFVAVSRTGDEAVLREVAEGGPPASPLYTNGDAAYVLFDLGGRSRVLIVPPGGAVSRNEFDGAPVAVVDQGDGIPLVVTTKGVWQLDGQLRWPLSVDEAPGRPVFGRDALGLLGVLPVGDRLLALLPDGTVNPLDLTALFGEGETTPFPVLADLDADGLLDVLSVHGTRLIGVGRTGAVVPGFPIALPAEAATQPLVATLTEGGNPAVVVAAKDGNVYAAEPGGEAVPGFPLPAGLVLDATPALRDGRLVTVSRSGVLQGWSVDAVTEPVWGELYGDGQNRSFLSLVSSIEPPVTPTSLLVEGETYNWPNPIREGQTRIRFLPTRPCRVRITIIDAAGTLIDEMTRDGVPAGVASEITWQTSAASGLYFARLTAIADDGTRESRMIKMAVIR